MPYIAFLLASGFGATSAVWFGRRGAWRTVALLSLAAASAAVVAWLIVIPAAAALPRAFINATLALGAAIVLPGVAGAAIAQARRTPWMLAAGFLTMAALWLLLAYVGLFPMCTLTPGCDL